jgi:hypothetical protein
MLQALGSIHLNNNNCGKNGIKEGDSELHSDVYMLQYWF